jgi:hypothetical protein
MEEGRKPQVSNQGIRILPESEPLGPPLAHELAYPSHFGDIVRLQRVIGSDIESGYSK